MTTDPNDCAFPINITCPEYDVGLSKREYFAALAMQGMLANEGITNHAMGEDSPTAYIAKLAVEEADELIKALNK